VVPGSHRANYMLPATLSVHPATGDRRPMDTPSIVAVYP
jgi:hypothetical protein